MVREKCQRQLECTERFLYYLSVILNWEKLIIPPIINGISIFFFFARIRV